MELSKQISKALTLKELYEFLGQVRTIIERAELHDVSTIAGCLIALRDRGQDLSDKWEFNEFAIYMSRLQLTCDKFENRFPEQNVWKEYECCENSSDSGDD